MPEIPDGAEALASRLRDTADLLTMFATRIGNPTDVDGRPSVVFPLEELRLDFAI